MNSKYAQSLYEAAMLPQRSLLERVLRGIWLVIASSFLFWLAWSEPFSEMLFRGLSPSIVTFVLQPAVMLLRAVLMVEIVGYNYHRFFQHVGFLTRQAHFIRKSQGFHWRHHMMIYPIGRFYKRPNAYLAAEKGAASWYIPGVIIALVFLATHGWTFAAFCFVAGLWLYAALVVDVTHSLFHRTGHPLANNRYFNWLENIHLLHHYDQYTNFSIVHPAMDWLFGTYRAPHKHWWELRQVVEDDSLTVSDIINWRYMLKEASPAEYAMFITTAQKHRRSIMKVRELKIVLEERLKTHSDDSEARDLLMRVEKFLDLFYRS